MAKEKFCRQVSPIYEQFHYLISVWLLSVVLLLPYWAPRGLLVALGGAWLMAAYTCLVVPVLISANYRYPARWYPAVVNMARSKLSYSVT